MGDDYIAIQRYYNKSSYVGNSACANMKFFVTEPQYWAFQQLGYNSVIDTTKSYTQAQKDFFNQNLTWKNNDTFPDNFAME
ncbi:MAG: hypothetical protein HW406_953 [Candidatus Brocadiaceae bacterium]|nr:hypothetical protein [Candidatus Brocadiaceae bacterium]